MSSSSSFQMHYLMRCSNGSHPICPIIKQISCFRRLHCNLQCFNESIRQRCSMHLLVFLFLMQYMIRYFSNRVKPSLSRTPIQLSFLNTYSSFLYCKRACNYSSLYGAAGSIVLLQSNPYIFCNSLLFSFSEAIWQVQLSYLHGESKFFAQYFMMSSSKQLAKASADQCLDKLFSLTSSILESKNYLTRGYLSEGSWPNAQSSQCLSRTEVPQQGQALMRDLIASSVPIFLS